MEEVGPSQVQAGLLINLFIEKFARNVFKDYMVLICDDGTSTACLKFGEIGVVYSGRVPMG